MFKNKIKTKLLKALAKINYGSLKIGLPDGDVLTFKGSLAGSIADITLQNWRVVTNLFTKGDVGFAEDYRDGYWSTSDLEVLLTFALQNEELFQHLSYGKFWFNLISKLMYFKRRNTVSGSKANIHKHYDLGNNFYKLWLDETMTYSAAIFSNPDMTLKDAQLNKYNRILSRFNKPHGNILEIGCGWGVFATTALKHGDYTIKGLTLSQEQAAYAKGHLGHMANIAIEDYREQNGKYDFIVSIEMLEAVGQKYWPLFFGKLKELLNDGGKIIIQCITIADDKFNDYVTHADAIRTFIFPGGVLPSESILQQEFNQAGLKCSNIYRFGQDYATTLRMWLKKFDEEQSAIEKLGFDLPFIRIWRFYLAYCSSAFANGRINVAQIELEHA